MSIKITNPGALSTVQDLGVKGYLSFGFPQCGALDQNALLLNNALLQNDDGEACIEMTLTGVTAIFNTTCCIALTGADFTPLINNRPVPMNAVIHVEKGQILRTPKAVSGARCYLGVAGGFAIEPVMGSRSTNLKTKSGGYNGRALQKGDLIKLRGAKEVDGIEKRHVPYAAPQKDATVRVVLGPQEHMFTGRGIKTLLTTEYTVSPQSDRMGMRLSGAALESRGGSDIVSDGIALGSIQVPASGEPIILLSDRQTTGGYAKIATVISADISRLAQLLPGGKVRFEAVTPNETRQILINERQKLKSLF